MLVAPFDLSARIVCGFVLRHIYSFHRYPPPRSVAAKSCIAYLKSGTNTSQVTPLQSPYAVLIQPKDARH